MGRIKVSSSLKRRVIREMRKNSHLGVRGLARFLEEKYKISISKSAIHKIIKLNLPKPPKGRKKAILGYKRREIKECGLFLLRCIDANVSLFDVLAEQLKVYFPKIKRDLLKKIVILVSLSAYRGGNIKKNIQELRFSRIADFYTLPHHKISYFLKKLNSNKPVISLEKVRDNLRLVSTIKFYFGNGYVGACDGKLSTFWDGPCHIREFYSTLKGAKEKLFQMLKEKIVILSYTKSFDYLSPLALNFIKGFKNGIKKIEFLDQKANVIEAMDSKLIKPDFVIGYYPKILNKGVSFLERPKRFKKLSVVDNDIFYISISTNFLQPKQNQEITLNNVLIKQKERFLPSWGVLTNKKENSGVLLKKYLLLWPYMEEVFLKEIEIIEKFLFSPKKTVDLREFVPKTLSLEKEADFAQIGHILASIFKEEIDDLDFKGKTGEFVIGKEVSKIVIKNIPLKIKKKFNNSYLFLNNKHIFLV